MDNEPKCGDCRKWKYTEGDAGRCMANAPSPTIMEEIQGGKGYHIVWPSTDKNEGCHNNFIIKRDLKSI